MATDLEVIREILSARFVPFSSPNKKVETDSVTFSFRPDGTLDTIELKPGIEICSQCGDYC